MKGRLARLITSHPSPMGGEGYRAGVEVRFTPLNLSPMGAKGVGRGWRYGSHGSHGFAYAFQGVSRGERGEEEVRTARTPSSSFSGVEYTREVLSHV